LRVPTPTREIWLWLNVPSDVVSSDVQGVLEAFMNSGAAGVSDRATGAAGFAISHRQAQLACRLGSLRGIRVSSYSEIALEALAFGGRDAARDFARAELGLLADDGERTELLRQTVQTYFAKGSSAAAAAESLGVAERTVTYRLRRAEELVGKPLSSRRAEIEAALRLHRVLDQVG
jgi:DNA-binding PucR family transcriptional regulator